MRNHDHHGCSIALSYMDYLCSLYQQLSQNCLLLAVYFILTPIGLKRCGPRPRVTVAVALRADQGYIVRQLNRVVLSPNKVNPNFIP